jgi:hypothetical protein
MGDMADKKKVVVESPEELGHQDTRRSFLRMLGLGGSIVLLPSLFAACGDDDGGPFALPPTGGGAASTSPVVLNLSTDIGILNYAYALEQIDSTFYELVVGLGNFQTLFPDAGDREAITDFRDNEVTQREFLRTAIAANGGTPVPRLATDFTALLTSRTTILTAAKTFEDLGVAAYNGAGKYLTSADLLTIAGKIVSVEARHAAAVRDMLDTTGTLFGNVGDIADLGANNAQGLDGALEPTAVLQRVAAQNVVRTPISIGTGPIAAPAT